MKTDLGTGNANFRTGVNVNTTVSLTRNGTSDGVGDTDNKRSTFQTVSESQNGVCSFSGLRYKHAHVVTEDGASAIEEIARKLYADWNLSKLFKDGSSLLATISYIPLRFPKFIKATYRQTAVVTCSTRNKHDPSASADSCEVLLQTAQSDGMVIKVHTPTHGVNNGLRLLVNFLLHEVVERTLRKMVYLSRR